MDKITFDYSKVSSFIEKEDILSLQVDIYNAHKMLHEKTGAGNDFLGWVDLPKDYDKDEFEKIKKAAKKIKEDSDVLIVIGIGGSYLGAKAAIEMLSHTFYNELSKEKRKTPQIYFAGQNISSTYLKHLLDVIEGKDVSLNVISKSGTTTEPAIAFRVLKEWMEKKYGAKDARHRIYATTDREKGALKGLSLEKGYETFVIPDDVGGRFSVLTAVGLLPIAVAGIDIDEIMLGALGAYNDLLDTSIGQNHCYQYALVRNLLYRQGKTIEILANYEPSMSFVGEWWKQLYGESEGKENKGIFPASVSFSTDLHSMGQYIQDGIRNIFETVLFVDKASEEIFIDEAEVDLDGLNYLAGKTMDFVNKKAFEGTLLAHSDGGVPNLIINAPEISPYYFGYLVYFFEKACGISGYLMDVNPFDQPGVEEYKKNMFALLGKPGFDEEKVKLLKRLEK